MKLSHRWQRHRMPPGIPILHFIEPLLLWLEVRRHVLGRHVLAHLRLGGVGSRQQDDAILVMLREERRDDRPDGSEERWHVDDQDLLYHGRKQARTRLLHRVHVAGEDRSRAAPQREEGVRAREVVDHRPEAQPSVPLDIRLTLQPAPLRHVEHVLGELLRRDGRLVRRLPLPVAHLVAPDHVARHDCLPVDDDRLLRARGDGGALERGGGEDRDDPAHLVVVRELLQRQPVRLYVFSDRIHPHLRAPRD
mmetsp:Transcript_25911/g.54947  ORF Transcript_25911/g.54947 Transcript_25911/m.54947 type:complete len:250 (-) Transcript_25911:39-788(-)